MPSTVVLLLSALLAQAPVTQRVVLISDPAAPSFEQSLVRHMLMQNLLTDASQEVVSDIPTAPGEHHASRLRRRARHEMQRAREELDVLSLEGALVSAAKARQKLLRVARLTGDITDLPESLALIACSLLLQGATAPAAHVVQELLQYDPDWRPDPAHFNPAMLARVHAAKVALSTAPTRQLHVRATRPEAALFVDGSFVGFGQARVSIVQQVPHLVWALAPNGQHASSFLEAFAGPRGRRGDPAPSLTLYVTLNDVVPALPWPASRFDALIAASRTAEPMAPLAAPALAAINVKRAFVLAYRQGELTLTHLQLEAAVRRRVRVPAIVTDLKDAKEVAEQLLAEPPELVPVPTPASRHFGATPAEAASAP